MKTFLSGHPQEALGVVKGIAAGLSKMFVIGPKRRANKRYQKRYGIGNPRSKAQSKIILPWQYIIRGRKKYSDLPSLNNKHEQTS